MIKMKFHHVGIACYDIEKTSQFYVALGYSKTDTVYDPIQNVNICFLTETNLENEKNIGGGNNCIELISPHDEKSPVNKNLQKNGVSPYHLCYSVKDIDTAIQELRSQCFIPVVKPVEAVAFGGKKVAFMFSKDVGLIELVEE